MQSEAMIRKAAEAIWAIRREEEDRCDMSLDDMGGEESSVWQEAKAALEAALSTDAEPVGWHIPGSTAITKDKDITDRWAIGNPSTIIAPVYAAAPAPAVAVKAIEAVWKYSLVIESSVRRGDGPDQYAGVTEALRLVKEARSALSAQVQDVAGWQDISTLDPENGMIVMGWGEYRERDGFSPAFMRWSNFVNGWSVNAMPFFPTHWMPLPAAPAAKQGEAE